MGFLDSAGLAYLVGKLKDYVGSRSGSAPNLLDNWYFADPVNQRGRPSFTGTCSEYGFDRWIVEISGSTGSVYLDSEKLYFTIAAGSESVYSSIKQRFENKDLAGKTVTLSMLTTDGLYKTSPFCLGEMNGARILGPFTVFSDTDYGSPTVFIRLYDWGGVTQSPGIIAFKLELGTEQTLACQDSNGNWVLNDLPPNKALELLKCQRYQIALRQPNFSTLSATIGVGVLWEDNTLDLTIPIPVTMRGFPSIIITGDGIVVNTMTGATTIASGSAYSVGAGCVNLHTTIEDTSGLAKGIVSAHCGPGSQVILDANL